MSIEGEPVSDPFAQLREQYQRAIGEFDDLRTRLESQLREDVAGQAATRLAIASALPAILRAVRSVFVTLTFSVYLDDKEGGIVLARISE